VTTQWLVVQATATSRRHGSQQRSSTINNLHIYLCYFVYVQLSFRFAACKWRLL